MPGIPNKDKSHRRDLARRALPLRRPTESRQGSDRLPDQAEL